MLTTDLLRWRLSGNQVQVIYVNPKSKKYLKIADDVISIYREHLRKAKGALSEALEAYEPLDSSYQVARGFAKVLEDKAEFEITSPLDPETLRRKVFGIAARGYPVVTEEDLLNRTTRDMVLKEAASQFGITEDQVEGGLYADLEGNRVMTQFEEPSPEWLLDRYNVALAQGMLYRCSQMRIRIFRNIPTKYKMVFKFIKFFKLMHTVEGNNDDGYHITLDGPASMFRLSQKYGIQMALFLPALLHCDRWWVDADIQIGPNQYRFKLNDTFGLKSHYKDVGEFDSELERVFYRKFEKAKTDWILERETEIINLKDTVMIPDFSFRHPDGMYALMEIVGFWTPDYLSRKIDKLKRAGRKDMLVAVSQNLNCSKEDFKDVPGEVIFFKTGINISDVLKKLDQCAR